MAMNESTCDADASVLRGLMHACTCMCIHIIWAVMTPTDYCMPSLRMHTEA